MTKKKLAVEATNTDSILGAIERKYKNEKLILVDGIKIERSDSWVHIRESNTEPIIRILTEAPSQKDSELLCNAFLEEIQTLSKQ